jgi:hypothetical protein
VSGRDGVLSYRPGYWMNETSGVLRRAVMVYLIGDPMTEADIAVLRGYFRQWIAAPGFIGADVAALRASVNGLTTRDEIAAWLERAVDAGVDPL